MATNNDKRTTDERRWPAMRWIESAKRWQVDGRIGTDGCKGGKRETFILKDEAKARRQELREQQKREGAESLELPTELRVEAVVCSRLLAEKGATLRQATDHYLTYLATSSRSVLWPEFLTEYLETFFRQTNAGRVLDVRKSHYDDVRHRLGHFAKWASEKLVSDITTAQIETWLKAQKVTKRGHPRLGQPLTEVSTRKVKALLAGAYNFALDQGYAKINPAETHRRTRRGKVERGGLGTSSEDSISHKTQDEILWPEEYAALLRVASEAVLPALVLQGFCGVRREEMQRCLWEQLDWKAGFFNIPANVSKTGDYRRIPIRPAVAAWLKKYRKHGKPLDHIVPKNYRKEVEATRVKAKELLDASGAKHRMGRWPFNCLRHGFASYYMALELDTEQALAKEMGTSLGLIQKTYCQVTTAKLGREYWAIRP